MAEKLELWGVNDPNISAQLALAVKLDLFKQEAGLDVSCKFIESGTIMPDEILKATHKPFAFAQTPMTAILLHERRFPTKLLAPLANIAGTQQMITHTSSKISQPKDIEGKRIGIAEGAAMFLALKNMAKDCNVDLQKVHFIHLLPHEQLAAFGKGTLDAMACWEPWTTKARKIGGNVYFSGTQSDIPGMEGEVNWLINQSSLIISDDNLKRYPEQAVALLNVLRKATDLLNNHRKAAVKELSAFFGVSQLELLMMMQKNVYSMAFDNLFRLGVLEFRDFLYDAGRVTSKFSETDLYTTAFLKKSDPSLVLLGNLPSDKTDIVGKSGIYYRKDLLLHPNHSRLQFLLADDSRYVRAALAKAVSIIGGKVVGEATNGGEAIEMFSKLRPNFVTMDLSMPGMSGVDAVRRILQIDPAATIIVISGIDMRELREEVFDHGVKIFITKPFDPLQVAEIIGLLLL